MIGREGITKANFINCYKYQEVEEIHDRARLEGALKIEEEIRISFLRLLRHFPCFSYSLLAWVLVVKQMRTIVIF